MAYFKLGSKFLGVTTTATAAGTTTLTASSKQYQQFTGTTTQIVVLPDATTLQTPRRFDILNRSTGAITVNANGGSLVVSVPAGSQRYVLLTDVSTAAGVWQIGGVVGSGGGSGGVSTADTFNLLTGMAGTEGSNGNIESRLLKLRPEELSGNYWLTRANLLRVNRWVAAMTLNGFIYANGGDAGGGGTFYAFNDIFNDDNNSWLARQSMTTARGRHGAFTLGSKNYAVAGFTTGTSRIATGEAYSDSTNTWTSITSLSTAITQMPNNLVVDDYGYLVGGETTGPAVAGTVNAYNATTNAWVSRFDLPALRSDLQSGVVDGNLSVFAGLSSPSFSFTNSNYKFNPANNSWVTKASLPVTRTGGAGFSAFDKIYAVAGYDGSAQSYSYEYNTPLDLWKASASTANARYDMSNCGGNLNAQGYVWSGSTAGGPLTAAVEAYRPFAYISVGTVKSSTASPTSILASIQAKAITNAVPVQIRSDGDNWKTFMTGSSSVLKTGESIATKFVQSSLMMACGDDGVATTEMYSFASNAWTTKLSMQKARNGAGRFGLEGYGYACGAGSSPKTENERFDDFANTWTSRAVMPQARERFTGHALNGFGYVHGASGTWTNNQNKYNPTLNSWTTPSSTYTTPTGYGQGYALLGFGYLVGGETTGGATSTQNAQYNDATDTFAYKAVVHAVQQGASAPGGGKGHVYGGYNGGSITTNAEYNPGTDSWTSRLAVPSGDFTQSGDFLNGTVWILGGSAPTNTVRQFNSEANTWTTKGSMNVNRSRPIMNNPGFYRSYEVRVGVPAYYAGVGSYAIVARSAYPYGGGAQSAQSIGDIAYVLDNANTTRWTKYQESLDTWTYFASTATIGRNGAAMFTLNDKGYSAGESGPSSQTSEYLNPTLAVSVAGPNPATLLYAGSSVGTSINGYGYYFGGDTTGSGSMINPGQRLDDSANSWTSRAGLTQSRNFCPNYALNGFIYITNGYSSYYVTSAVHEQYNDAANTITAKTSFPTARSGSGKYVTQTNGAIICGGNNNSGTSGSAECFKYSDALNAWIRQIDLPAVHVQGNYGNTSNDGCIIAGTYDSSGGGTLNSTCRQFVPSVKNAVLGIALEIK